jgi:hypothetical protein
MTRRSLANVALLLLTGLIFNTTVRGDILPKYDGYNGIWYLNTTIPGSIYKYKYSGGFATYPAQIIPFAIYAPEVNKTFFCYGGARTGTKTSLVIMISYYDHTTGMVPKPRIVMDKLTTDAHENPSMLIDNKGYIWIYANTHGDATRSYVFKSKNPHSIDEFDQILNTNFSYSQSWYIPGSGFFLLHTVYEGGSKRTPTFMTSADGISWSPRQKLIQIEEGDYQGSWVKGNKIGVVFDYLPTVTVPGTTPADNRTNLYYIESDDFGNSWHTADGQAIGIPITNVDNPCAGSQL